MKNIKRFLYLTLAAATLPCHLAICAENNNLPNGFVYLRKIDPSILQDIRYSGARNFTGKKVPGYEAEECVLVKDAAIALSKAQKHLNAKGLGLKVFDCYRPVSAVKRFVAWAKMPTDPNLQKAYHPRIKKSALFPVYIARRSSHSRGAALDLTLVTLKPKKNQVPSSGPCKPPKTHTGPHPELDMGTTFDCFDQKSQTMALGVTEEQRQNRLELVKVLVKFGFKNYPGEWWHFSFRNEPYRKRHFNFPIRPIATAKPTQVLNEAPPKRTSSPTVQK